MKAIVKDSRLQIGLTDLLETMDPEARSEVARFVGARGVLFQNVVECLVTGTYNNDADDGGWWFDSDRVAELRGKVLELLPEIEASAAAEARSLTVQAERMRSEALTKQWAAERERDEARHLLRRATERLDAALVRLANYEPIDESEVAS